MTFRYWVRKLHRWVGLAVVIQLVAWTVGGLYFSLVPIEQIRGEHLMSEPRAISPSALKALVSPGRIANALNNTGLHAVEIVERRGRIYYRVTSDAGVVQLFDAQTAQQARPVTQAEAEAIASTALIPDASIQQVRLIEEVSPGHEYRGRPLPAFEITFDHDSGIRVYVAQQTGEITARRTDAWRIFDFLWMLHIMDFESRDDFNHPLLTFVASVALFVLLSGALLWWQTSQLRRRLSSRRSHSP